MPSAKKGNIYSFSIILQILWVAQSKDAHSQVKNTTDEG